MKAKSAENNARTLIAQNHKASYEYFIDEVVEAGIVLFGSEVKSLRKNRASLAEAHAAPDGGEVFIYNLNIIEYTEANRFNHYPKRPKKLLLHWKEIKRFIGLVQRQGVTLVPLKMYFNHKNIAKILIGVSRGKKQSDKRETIKQREWQRIKARVMKNEY
ncbi:SsrA-binding protein [Alphaproteobacteria bacterium]